MQVLIVEADAERAALWSRKLEAMGSGVVIAGRRQDAIRQIREHDVSLIVLNLGLPEDGAFAVADFASYARPEARVLFVSSSSMLSDGSVFRHAANACGFLGADTPPEDIAAIALHHAGRARRAV